MPGSLIQGNALCVPLKDKSVQLCCFSPPYWKLRKYKVPNIEFPDGWVGQLGLEPNIDQYLDNLMLVMAEVWRVLRDDGCVFVNIGDSFWNASGSCRSPSGRKSRIGVGKKNAEAHPLHRGNKTDNPNIQAKTLCLIPQKFAIRCQEAGWIVRSEIIFHKLNPIPESVNDRPTKAHEHVWLLTKQRKYFWDKEAVKEKTRRVVSVGWKNSDLKKYSCDPRLEKQGSYKDWRKYCPTGLVEKRNIRSVWTMATESNKDWAYDFENADYVDGRGIPRIVSPDCPVHGLNAQPPQVSDEASSCDEQQDQQFYGISHKKRHLSQEPFASVSPSNDCKNLKEMDNQRFETLGGNDVNKKHDVSLNGVKHKISSHNSNTQSQQMVSMKDSSTPTYSEPAILNSNQNHKNGHGVSLVEHDKVSSQSSCRKMSKQPLLFLNNQEQSTFENNISADVSFGAQSTKHTQTPSHNIDKSQLFSCQNNNAAKCTCQESRTGHFATFPSKLVRLMILAGSSPRACEICGAPWRRVVKREEVLISPDVEEYSGKNYVEGGRSAGRRLLKQMSELRGLGRDHNTPYLKTRTIGWRPTCKCGCAGTGRCVVLDPFVGVGTSVVVAEKNGRFGVGMDLSLDYLVDIALKKIRVPVQKMLELRW